MAESMKNAPGKHAGDPDLDDLLAYWEARMSAAMDPAAYLACVLTYLSVNAPRTFYNALTYADLHHEESFHDTR